MTFIGIDNGVTGTIGILDEGGKVIFVKTPILKSKHYAKSRDMLTRIDRKKLAALLAPHLPAAALIEAPFTNPGMFQATLSNHRSHAEICGVLEDLGITFETVLPKVWQGALLPGVEGREWLKEASKKRGQELFPSVAIKTPDADGLLIAQYLKQTWNSTTGSGPDPKAGSKTPLGGGSKRSRKPKSEASPSLAQ